VTGHGIIHAYNARKQRITLAAGGALLRMKLARTGARTLMASAPPPKVGDEVTVTASVDENDDTLEATEVDADQAADDAQADENDDQQGEQDDGQQAQDDTEQAEQEDQGAGDDSGQASESGNGSGDDGSSDDGGSDGSGSGDEEGS
jgi:hypothetical protein